MRALGALALAATAAFIVGCAARPVDDAKWTAEYDGTFRKYSRRFFGPAFDWRWWKAQAIAESSLRFDAASHAGAQGLMQIMPATWEQIAEQAPLTLTDAYHPGQSIAAGIWYDAWLYARWTDLPGRRQRLAFTLASYNGGRGRILRAQDRCGGCAGWPAVSRHAPAETVRYVERIMGLMGAAP